MTTRPRGFAPWAPSDESLALVDQIEGVLNEYRVHLPLTMRQVFYRLVGSQDYAKTERDYKRLLEVANRARRAHLLRFADIRDDGVTIEKPYCFTSLEAARDNLVDHAEAYNRDRQEGQEQRLMVFCEAGGMVPQLVRVCRPYSIPVQSAGGFDSSTAKHALAQQLAKDGSTLILHIGDHDPSGVHIFSSLAEDVTAFASVLGGDVEFRRHAVTPEQVLTLGLEPAPAKATDNRSFEGIGGDPNATVQAEAIPPDILARDLKAAIEEHMEMGIYEDLIEAEEEERDRLVEAIEQIEV